MGSCVDDPDAGPITNDAGLGGGDGGGSQMDGGRGSADGGDSGVHRPGVTSGGCCRVVASGSPGGSLFVAMIVGLALLTRRARARSRRS